MVYGYASFSFSYFDSELKQDLGGKLIPAGIDPADLDDSSWVVQPQSYYEDEHSTEDTSIPAVRTVRMYQQWIH